jgi:hypothetical protein
MTLEEMQRMLIYCQILAIDGLSNGTNAIIPELTIDLLSGNSFFGLKNNPAIFVTEITYKKLKHVYPDWIPNVTIAISQSFLDAKKTSPIDIIGVLVHEAGHAFNVYGRISNNEANAYIFEIETLLKLYNMSVLSRQFDISKQDMTQYFQSRLNQYQMNKKNGKYLQSLIDEITETFELENHRSHRVIEFVTKNAIKIHIKLGFFKHMNSEDIKLSKDSSFKPYVNMTKVHT